MTGRPPIPLNERFWPKVDIRGPDECWEWKSSRDKDGYGRISINRVTRHASRAAWMLTYGDPGQSFICHRCDNPPCVNPAHLFLGTPKDNMSDMLSKGRGTARGTARKAHLLSKITEAEARRIKFGGEPPRQLSIEMGIPLPTVRSIRAGYNWAWLQPAPLVDPA